MKRRFSHILAAATAVILTVSLTGITAVPAVAATSGVTVAVPAIHSTWTDTGVAVVAGQTVSITATGTVCIVNVNCGAGTTPAGGSNCVANQGPNQGFLVSDVPCWSLVGQIGDSPPFEVGTALSFTATSTGSLYLAVDDNFYLDNSGAWTATISITNPSLTIISPATKAGPPGTVIQWTASGLPSALSAEEIITAPTGQTFDLGTYTTDAAGEVSGLYVIPCDATPGGVWTLELKASYATPQDQFTVSAPQGPAGACQGSGAGAGTIPYPVHGPKSLTVGQLSADVSYLEKALQGLARPTLTKGQLEELGNLVLGLSGCIPVLAADDVSPECVAVVIEAAMFLRPMPAS